MKTKLYGSAWYYGKPLTPIIQIITSRLSGDDSLGLRLKLQL